MVAGRGRDVGDRRDGGLCRWGEAVGVDGSLDALDVIPRVLLCQEKRIGLAPRWPVPAALTLRVRDELVRPRAFDDGEGMHERHAFVCPPTTPVNAHAPPDPAG